MTAALAHRGPDGSGLYADEGAGIALGHRRLAVLDLSEAASQPMRSRCGRYVLSYNGEVYNFAQLREELGGSDRFEGTGDTEVVLACIERYGAVEAARRFVGMFAFALWDARERTLTLVRDRLGIKPLYVGRVGGDLAFASELAGPRALEGFEPAIDLESLALYLRYGCVPQERCIYVGWSKVGPGEALCFSSPDQRPHRVRYWSAAQVVGRGRADPLRLSDAEAIERVEAGL
ncbi:MAG: hypothetical protein OEY14_13995, partial [Myxococcales bacterium]|nr:hypothetical protein [Myxococcales bacterium]